MKIVVKLGGELAKPENRQELSLIADELQKLTGAGHEVIVVHGGGPQTTALMRQLGQEPNIVGGRRVTDEAALDALLMAVAGKVNVTISSVFLGRGINAVGLTGVSARIIGCKKRPPKLMPNHGPDPVDFGFVGDVTEVNTEFLSKLSSDGYTPVLACVGVDSSGQPFNINADTVANGLSVALKADRLLLLTGVPGVLLDIDNPESRIPKLTVEEGYQAIADGTVFGGMIPKLEESFSALKAGVGQINILGKLNSGDIEQALQTAGSVGTALLP